jgi:hypothetical protein
LPTTPVSDDPKASTIIRFGSSSRSRALAASDRMAPPDPITHSELVSYRPGFAASSSARGRAMASPTRTRVNTCSRPTRSQMVGGSNRPSGTITSFPALNSW